MSIVKWVCVNILIMLLILTAGASFRFLWDAWPISCVSETVDGKYSLICKGGGRGMAVFDTLKKIECLREEK